MVKRLTKIAGAFSRILEGIIVFCFLSIVVLVTALVILRYGFNTTIIGGNELVVILFVYTSALGAAVVIGKKEHIAITYFIDKLPPFLKKIVDVFDFALIAFINGVMVWYSYLWISKTGSYSTAVLRIPQIYAQIVVPIGCGAAMLFCFYHILLILDTSESN